ncbi:MAG TPA: helix-turn-helix transcriptional regulator [Pelolinea sp.]|nr:helix-turn-helix transcriptional regulator [Pelolinea sp.]
MDIQTNFPLENLAEGLIKAREYRRMSLKDAAGLLGLTIGKLRNYEKGKYTPSLPELESLSYIYGLPLKAIFSPEELSNYFQEPDADQLQQLIQIRKNIISTTLQITFDESGFSLKDVAKNTGISTAKIKKYLSGAEIPLDDLKKLSAVLDFKLQNLMDKDSQIGRWQVSQSGREKYISLPENIRDFLAENENWDFLNLAVKLNSIGISQLQSVSDALLQLRDLK